MSRINPANFLVGDILRFATFEAAELAANTHDIKEIVDLRSHICKKCLLWKGPDEGRYRLCRCNP